MSAVVKTVTPFIDKKCLLKALDELGVEYTIEQNEIVTERIDYQGNQKFIYADGRYKFQYDSYQAIRKNYKEFSTVNKFLQAVEKEYNIFYEEKLAELERKRLEEEAKRLEEKRKAFIEKQKKAIIAKAKAKGYSVKEKKVGNKIKLVLVRHTY